MFCPGTHKNETVKGSVTVAELVTTQPINSMILNGQLQTSVNGVNIQNGLATQINAKVIIIMFKARKSFPYSMRQFYALHWEEIINKDPSRCVGCGSTDFVMIPLRVYYRFCVYDLKGVPLLIE